jgi:hypothetical protein
MGPGGIVLAAKATSAVDVDRVLRAFDFGPRESADDGWFLSEADHPFQDGADDLRQLVAALEGPAFVVEVFPSEWAYLIAWAPGSDPMVVVVTPKALRKQIGTRFEAWLDAFRPGR